MDQIKVLAVKRKFLEKNKKKKNKRIIILMIEWYMKYYLFININIYSSFLLEKYNIFYLEIINN